MRKLNLQFQDKAIEAEYSQLKDQTKMILCFWTIEILFLIGEMIARRNIQGIFTCCGILLFFIIMACAARRLSKYIEKITFTIHVILVTVIFILIIFYAFAISGLLLFIRGYSMGTMQIMLMSRFAKLRSKLIFGILSYMLRFGVLGHVDSSILRPDLMIRALFYDMLIMYMFFSNEKKERLTFQSFYNYRQEVLKFRELVANYLTQGITIVDCKKQESLFSNQVYENLQREIKSDLGNISETPLDLNMETPLNIVSLLDCLKVQANTLRQINISQEYEKSLKEIEYLTDLVQVLSKDQIMKDIPFAVGVEIDKKSFKRKYEATLIPMTWGQEDAIAIILNDITYQEKLLSLKIADANKDKVIATVSHELRTPLNGIIGILHMVHEKVKEPEVLEYLSLCEDNANLLLNLVNSILDLHQISQQKLKLNLSEVSIDNLFKETLRLFYFQAESKGIYLTLKIAGDVPITICTDSNRLRQILINLIGNALKFTLKGGITVQVIQDEIEEEYLQIIVEDTGIGIKKEDKNKLFKMYGRLEDNESVNKTGVGLGLTISNALSKLLCRSDDERGIILESQEGVGSKFKFRILKNLQVVTELAKNDKFEMILENINESAESKDYADSRHVRFDTGTDEEPTVNLKSRMHSCVSLYRHQMMPEMTFRSPGDKKALNKAWSSTEELLKTNPFAERTYSNFKYEISKMNSDMSNSRSKIQHLDKVKRYILVVDDNSFNLLIARNFVENLGYTVETAMNGKDAIEKLKARARDSPAFKMILMDCQMPVMDGFEATEILRDMMKKGEIYKVPIVALTANTSEEDKKRCLEAGMVDHLAKPLLMEPLANVLLKYSL